MCSQACSEMISDNGQRPVLQLRFRSPTTGSDENWRKTYQMLAENPGCCDEVWFSTGIGVPPLECHAENAARIACAAEELRHIGVASSIQIQATIGHSDDLSALERTARHGVAGQSATERNAVTATARGKQLFLITSAK